MHSPSALTEHVSPNLAGTFLLDPALFLVPNTESRGNLVKQYGKESNKSFIAAGIRGSLLALSDGKGRERASVERARFGTSTESLDSRSPSQKSAKQWRRSSGPRSEMNNQALPMGHGVRCAIPHCCIFVTYTQCVSPNLEPESALDASC